MQICAYSYLWVSSPVLIGIAAQGETIRADYGPYGTMSCYSA